LRGMEDDNHGGGQSGPTAALEARRRRHVGLNEARRGGKPCFLHLRRSRLPDALSLSCELTGPSPLDGGWISPSAPQHLER
jgi:hypothetical protein